MALLSAIMIKSYTSKETEKLFNRQFSRKIPQNIHQAARRKLETLDAAEALQDLRIPIYKLKPTFSEIFYCFHM